MAEDDIVAAVSINTPTVALSYTLTRAQWTRLLGSGKLAALCAAATAVYEATRDTPAGGDDA